MAKRIILAGILGGIAMFAWQSISHLVLPLGEVGVRRIHNEDAVIAHLQENIYLPGFYIFPDMEQRAGMTKEQRQAAILKHRTGPTGILIYDTRGSELLSAKQLLTQLGADIVVVLLAAFLLAQSGGLKGYVERLAFVTLLGAIPWLTVNVSYWNWYAFPSAYTLAQFVEYGFGFFVAGLVLAKIVDPSPNPATPATSAPAT